MCAESHAPDVAMDPAEPAAITELSRAPGPRGGTVHRAGTDSAQSDEPPQADDRTPLFRIDPGWLFLLAGAAVIAVTVLIPAVDDLSEAKWHRDRARAVEQYRSQRLGNYSLYLDALSRREPTLVMSLAATQLNLAPADKLPMLDLSERGLPDATVWAGLEPELAKVPSPPRPNSMLQRWATNEGIRPWLLAGGAFCLLLGLLPASRRL